MRMEAPGILRSSQEGTKALMSRKGREAHEYLPLMVYGKFLNSR
jgi:hypothetical protein